MRTLLQLVLLLASVGAWGAPGLPYFAKTQATGSWTPRNLNTLQYWWVSSDLTNGWNVTNWVERIVGLPATQTVYINQPTNSSYGVYFSGSTWLTNNPFDATEIGTNNISTLFVILKPSANADFAGIVTCTHGASQGLGFRSRSTDQFNYAGGVFANGHNYCAYKTNADYDVAISFITNSQSRFYTNGVYVADNADGNPTFFEMFGNGVGQVPYRGYIREIMTFTTNLSDADVTLLHSYATNTYLYNPTIPSISVQPVSVTCLTNSIQQFSVTATGNPAPTYQWTTNGVNLSNGTMWSGATTSGLWVTNNGTLFTNLPIQCVASNLSGSVTSSIAYLTTLPNAMTNGLLAWYSLDTNTINGNTVAAVAGFGNTLTSAVPIVSTNSTLPGQAIYFGGTQVLVGLDTGLPTGDATLCCWYKGPTAQGGYNIMFGYGTYGTVNLVAELFLGPNNASLNLFGASQYGNSLSVNDTVENVWHFGVATKTGNTWVIWRDATWLATKSMTTTTTLSKFFVGGDPTTNSCLTGFLDELRVYGRVLTTNEIQTLYQLRY